ncbi:Oidioi.mRNA.OKI2018_I69.PAR.g8528.t1.cds [Oikopleura dioica]|uniref:Oidioi.mRNA.OKI2018_I69.PAR.g8528.t1.cds n=1 Tax=Oikopleura dioica TaxID=34765 RepID=A0ABN7RNV4_OIKDI|nr:Oidioi.mRNA.OKI2018_I69.PAR.g8528.t1.cds [Oikopleura dioica]
MKLSTIFSAISAVSATVGNTVDDCTLDHSVLSGDTRIFSAFNRNKKVPRPGAVGDDSAKIKFTIYGSVDTDYTGFLLFFKQDCGIDFLRALEDGRVTWDILDRGNYYTPEFVYHRVDKTQTNVALQFRHAGEPASGTVWGNSKKDMFALQLHGLKSVNWGNFDMNTCLTTGMAGKMPDGKIPAGSSVGDDFSACAAWARNIW